MDEKTRHKIIGDLEAGKEYIEYEGRIYFKSVSGVASLPKNAYFQRLNRLKNYFKDWEKPNEVGRLILENLAIGAIPIPDREYTRKVEIVYESAFVTVAKISDYPPEEDFTSPTIKELTSVRGEKLVDKESPWHTERNEWIFEYAKKIRDWLRGDKD